MATEKCPNCGQFKFEPDWMANNPGCALIIGGFILSFLLSFIVPSIVGIVFIIFVVLGIIGMFIKQKVVEYKCKNCDYTEKYKKE